MNKRWNILAVCLPLFAGTVAMTTLAWASRIVDVYTNSEFGFSIQVPPHRPTCGAQPDTHNTGIIIFLDDGPSDCAGQNRRTFLAVNGAYNSTDARTAYEVLSTICGTAQAMRTNSKSLGNLTRKWPAMCRVEYQDGYVDMILVNQRRESIVRGYSAKDETPLINYTVVLHTRSKEFNGNFKDAKEILRTMRLFAPSK
jgi:hypothetical protein